MEKSYRLSQQPVSEVLKQRSINFNCEFTREYVTYVISLMNKIKAYDDLKNTPMDERVITFNIYSYGGQIYSLLALLDAMDSMRKEGYKINTVTTGFSASCGFILSIYGDKRYMTKNARLLNHQGSSYAYGTLKDIEVSHKELKRLEEVLNNIIRLKTKFTEEELMRPYNENIDIYYDCKECLHWGIVDEVL